MNKTFKIVLIVALCLFGVGLLTLIGTSIVTGYKLADIGADAGKAEMLTDQSSVRTVEKEFKDGKQDIELDVSFADITVAPSTDGKIHLSYTENDKMTFKLRETDGKIILSQEQTTFKLLGALQGSARVELLLPKEHKGDLEIDSASGEVELEGVTISGELEIDTASGSISAQVCGCSDADISTASGRLELINVEAESFDLSTASGLIFLESLNNCDISATAASGTIELNALDAGTLELGSHSGGIRLSAVKADSASIEVSSGDCYIKDGDFTLLQTKSISGSIRGTLVGNDEDYEIVSNTNSGKNSLFNLGKAGAKRSITASSASGSIDLSFED